MIFRIVNKIKDLIVKIRKIISDALSEYPSLFKFAIKIYRILKLPTKLARINYQAIKQSFNGEIELISRSQASYMGDGFATTHYVAFLHDENFCEAYRRGFDNIDNPELLKVRDSFGIAWRAHIATWAANQALKINGDFVECGVWYGALSKTICEYTDFPRSGKRFFLVDTWGDPTSDSLHQNYTDDMYSVVKERFRAYPNVHLVRGSVPEILEEVPTTQIAYLAIDMNGYIAERKTLEKYYDMVVPGGIIYFDDYGWEYPKLREAVDSFFKDKPEKLLHFPSGNSIVVKI